MGLSLYASNETHITSHITSISYGGFHSFRIALAATIGVDLVYANGYGGTEPLPEHPLTTLLDHSDCEGELSSEECSTLWPALLAAADAIDEEWQDFCRHLAEGFKEAAHNSLFVLFI